jgi:hypothetical protein
MIESFSEDSKKVVFELVEMVNNICEETIEHLESRVHVQIV